MTEYNWGWLIGCIVWMGLQGYWAGHVLERTIDLPISLAMLMLSTGTALAFLYAFINSGEDKK